MNSYDQSSRSRPWRDSTHSVFDSVFGRQPKSHSGPILTIIFVVTVLGIVLLHDSDSVFWVFALGVVFASPFLRGEKSRHDDARPNPPGQPYAAPTASDQSISPEAERLLAALEQLEKRLVNLETIITQKEFDWERRLNEDPHPSATPLPVPGPPVVGSPIA
jgi:hypothetical protein